jgi:hypothetical protein
MEFCPRTTNFARLNNELTTEIGRRKNIVTAVDGPRSWSLTSLIKIGAEVVSRSRHVTFQTAEIAVPAEFVAQLRASPAANPGISVHDSRRSPLCRRAWIGAIRNDVAQNLDKLQNYVRV